MGGKLFLKSHINIFAKADKCNGSPPRDAPLWKQALEDCCKEVISWWSLMHRQATLVCGVCAQSCLTLSWPHGQRPTRLHGILQARILEWVDISSSRGSFLSGDGTRVSCIAGRFLTTEPSGKPQHRAKGEQKRCLMYTLRQLPTFSTSFLYSFTSSCTDPSIHPSDLFHPYHVPGICWALGHRDLKAKTRQFLLGRNSHRWSPRFHSSPNRWRGCDAQKKGGLPQAPTVSGPASSPSPPFHELFTLNPWIYLWNIQAQGSFNFNSWIDGFNSFFFSAQNFLLKNFFSGWWWLSPSDLWEALD